MLPEYLFVSSTDGALYDTRAPQWSTRAPVRAIYCRTFSKIENTLQLRATLRAGPYAWPGGYPLFFLASDFEALSFETVRANYRQIARSIKTRARDGWRVIGCAINYEDSDLTCAHSGAPIACAKGGES